MVTTLSDIWKILETVPDPEIPVINLVELGVIRDVSMNEDSKQLTVVITPTYTGCPAKKLFEDLIRETLADHGAAFFQREQRRFLQIDGDSDDDPVKELQSPFDNIDMAVGDRVKRAGIQCDDFHSAPRNGTKLINANSRLIDGNQEHPVLMRSFAPDDTPPARLFCCESAPTSPAAPIRSSGSAPRYKPARRA